MAHRVAWELINGPIPKGMFVCHHCDNPSCVNPSHLFSGTQKENLEDCAKKGRMHRGEANGIAKLDSNDVYQIRYYLSIGYSQRRIARMFNVSQTVIKDIKIGKTWGWLK